MAKKTLEYSESTQTLVGTQRRELMDVATGDIMTVDQITKMVYGTKNFWKCYLMDFLTVLGIIDSKQVDVFIYIVENVNQSTNQFVGTYRKIASDLHISLDTVTRIMKKLQEANFIKKIQNGVYYVNPNILMKGNDKKRQILLNYYEAEEPINAITYSRTKQRALKQEGEQLCGASKEQNLQPTLQTTTEEDSQ